MSRDLEIIKQIEKILDIELEELPLEKIIAPKKPGKVSQLENL